MIGTINIDTTTNILSVTSNTVWGVYISILNRNSVANRNGYMNDSWDVSFLEPDTYLAELAEQDMGVVDMVVWTKTSRPAESHLECVSGFCQKVNGVIADSCAVEGDRCDTPRHKACVSGMCNYIEGTGSDECTTLGVSCSPPTNYAAWGIGIAGLAGIYYILTRQTARVRSGYEAAKREYGRAKTSYKTLRNR